MRHLTVFSGVFVRPETSIWELVLSYVGPRDWAQVARLVSQCPVPLATKPFHWSLIFDTINYLMSKNHKTFSTSGLHLAILLPKSQCQRSKHQHLKKKVLESGDSNGLCLVNPALATDDAFDNFSNEFSQCTMQWRLSRCESGVVITWYFSSFSYLPSQGTIQVHWQWKKEIVWTYLLLGTDLFSVS